MYLSPIYKHKIFLVLIFLLCVRVFAMWIIPLTDTTEARYGEIARKMLETDNWISPLNNYNLTRSECEPIACVKTATHNYAIPFWAKPPLSFWSSALSMKFLGVNEFAARLPSLLYSLGLLCLMMLWLKEYPNQLAILSITILSTSLVFAGSAGLVMTDLSLIFCSTLAMISFWQAILGRQKYWGLVFFGSLGLGMLAKGPLIFVLAGLPIMAWTCWNRNYRLVWQSLPWVKGSLLTALVAVPWYWLAELKTPGFISYFIVGEHFKRFLISGWQGDLYGHAHSEPLGMIWFYFFIGFLPWSFLLLLSILKISAFKISVLKSKTIVLWRNLFSEPWMRYLLCWATLPVLFFTFAHNIIHPYVLPAMPAAACLFAEILIRINNAQQIASDKRFFQFTLFAPMAIIISVSAFCVAPDLFPKRSEKDVIAAYMQNHHDEHSQLIYFDERLYSADFYSKGRSTTVHSIDKLIELTTNEHQDFVVVNNRHSNPELTLFLQNHFMQITSRHGMTLYSEPTEKKLHKEITNR